ncbi:MAG TPA: hypothetical protein VFQ22_04125, partial [Longimicrobiales bacterium]|nr:hypothetical protein [Longimicrobiales bacterium]
AVEYSLWDLEVWMPRSLRLEGTAAAGILKAPVAIDVAYEMESVTTPRSLAAEQPEGRPPELALRTEADTVAWLERLAFGGTVAYAPVRVEREGEDRTVRFLIPEDSTFLARSPALPPPVWEDAPGFATSDEIDAYVENLAQLPQTGLASVPWTVRWGPQRPDLVRYNRVEALSLGVRAQVRPSTPLGPVSLTGTVRLGVGDLVPNASLEATRETIERRISLSAYHELASIDERARHLGIGNSLLAATVGRDDGDYYRRSGAMLQWTPPVSVRRTFRVRAWAEHQEGVEAETDFALFRIGSDAFAFRPNLDAADVWEYGGSLELSPWWGTDPNLAQGGLDAYVQGAVGDAEYARASLTARLVVPLAARLRLGLEAGAGTAWGSPTPQRLWYVGGPLTLRGYEPRAAGGTSFARARVELARAFSFGRVSIFSDAAWAGPRGDVDLDDALRSIGLGYSILDGLIRFDAAWGLDGPEDFRLEAYLDQIL